MDPLERISEKVKVRYLLAIMFLFLLAACGEEAAPAERNGDTQQEVSVSFRNLDIQVEDTSFVLTGEVNAKENIFYYAVKQGKNELISEESIEVAKEGASWTGFEITGQLPEEAVESKDAPIIMLYGKTADGEEINPNYIPIDIGIK